MGLFELRPTATYFEPLLSQFGVFSHLILVVLDSGLNVVLPEVGFCTLGSMPELFGLLLVFPIVGESVSVFPHWE